MSKLIKAKPVGNKNQRRVPVGSTGIISDHDAEGRPVGTGGRDRFDEISDAAEDAQTGKKKKKKSK